VMIPQSSAVEMILSHTLLTFVHSQTEAMKHQIKMLMKMPVALRPRPASQRSACHVA